jgi:hypothetical protein
VLQFNISQSTQHYIKSIQHHSQMC